MLKYTLVGTLLALMTLLPLQWRLRVGDTSLRRTAFVIIVLAVLASLLATLIGTLIPINTVLRVIFIWFLTPLLTLATVAYCFYRNPRRTPPDRDDVIISPADGEVIYVREARNGILPVSTKQGRNYTLHELTKTPLHMDDAVVIGIWMTLLDVHVNRAPIAGRIVLQRHFPGSFYSKKEPGMEFENERATTIIEREGLQVAMAQIASRLVRQIASFVREGQEVALGQRMGMIRFGSQVDLVLPAREDVKVIVQPGTRVRAGETIIAAYAYVPERNPMAEAAVEVSAHRSHTPAVQDAGRA